MRKRYLGLLLAALVGIGLFFYNYWSYSCGRCNAETLLTLGLPAKILIGINLSALGVLLTVKNRRRTRPDPLQCLCGERLLSSWRFCPCCGQPRTMEA